LRGRQPAWQTARATRSNSELPGNRWRSRSVRRPFEAWENVTSSILRHSRVTAKPASARPSSKPRGPRGDSTVDQARGEGLVDADPAARGVAQLARIVPNPVLEDGDDIVDVRRCPHGIAADDHQVGAF